MTICLLSYSFNKKTNLFQIINEQFLYANYIFKKAIKSYHQIGLVVSIETIQRFLQINTWAILSMLKKRIKTQQFFLSYNNMNFYDYVYNQRLYNKRHLVNFIAGYVYFMNALDSSPFLHISCESVQYNAVNSLTANNFLLDRVGGNYYSAAMSYILGHTLKKHFGNAIKV